MKNKLKIVAISMLCVTQVVIAKEMTNPINVTYLGGDGSSIEQAIIIKGAPNEHVGVSSEYKWLHGRYPLFKKKAQSLLPRSDRYYDKLEIILGTGEVKSIFFDITEYFGKF